MKSPVVIQRSHGSDGSQVILSPEWSQRRKACEVLPFDGTFAKKCITGRSGNWHCFYGLKMVKICQNHP